MSLAIFDLDNTLLAGDSDHLWGEYLIEQGLVEGVSYKSENDKFYQDYVNGSLDIEAFLHFSLQPLTQLPISQLKALRQTFITEKIDPIILPAAKSLIDQHRAQGHSLLIITATNNFVTEPIAAKLNIPHLLATEAELGPDGYTGKFVGEACFQEGKVINLSRWLESNPHDMKESWFYSDSFNDIPLLNKVSYPIAVDPDDRLRAHATLQKWKIISLRE